MSGTTGPIKLLILVFFHLGHFGKKHPNNNNTKYEQHIHTSYFLLQVLMISESPKHSFLSNPEWRHESSRIWKYTCTLTCSAPSVRTWLAASGTSSLQGIIGNQFVHIWFHIFAKTIKRETTQTTEGNAGGRVARPCSRWRKFRLNQRW